MATAGGRTDSSLETMLFDSGFQFEFFQAVRLLALIYPKQQPVGGAARPPEEIVRFTSWPPEAEKLASVVSFPASPIDIIQRPLESAAGKPSVPPRMTTRFLGLTGIQGILPMHYTEMLIARKGEQDHALADFLDLFHHRLLSLFYRTWAKYRPVIAYEASFQRVAAGNHEPDAFTHSILDFMGLGTNGIRGQMRIPDENLLPYVGLIAQRPHSASAVRAILRDYFGVPVEIEQCLGRWYPLSEADRSYLAPQSERNQLGVGAFLGEKVWNQQDRLRIRVGPLKRKRFLEFLPNGRTLPQLVELARFLVGQALAFDVQVVLAKEEVPDCQLLEKGDQAPRLGWMSWLKTKGSQLAANATDAVFSKAVAVRVP